MEKLYSKNSAILNNLNLNNNTTYQIIVRTLGLLLLEEPEGAPAAHAQQDHDYRRYPSQQHPVMIGRDQELELWLVTKPVTHTQQDHDHRRYPSQQHPVIIGREYELEQWLVTKPATHDQQDHNYRCYSSQQPPVMIGRDYELELLLVTKPATHDYRVAIPANSIL